MSGTRKLERVFNFLEVSSSACRGGGFFFPVAMRDTSKLKRVFNSLDVSVLCIFLVCRGGGISPPDICEADVAPRGWTFWHW